MTHRALSALIRLLLLSALIGTTQCQTLKIDYSSYLGGSADDWGYAITTDATGAIYIAGFTQSSDFPLVNALQPYYAGGTGDLFIAKLKADGSGFQYITYLGGSGGEGDVAGFVGGIAVDAQGNAYVAGITRSPDFPTTAGAFQPSIGSQFVCDSDPNAGLCGDAFVLKLSAAGDRLIYSTYLGGSYYDDAKAIAIDSTGAAYITGITSSPDFPTTNGAFQTQLNAIDAYVAKLSPDGFQLLYSTLIGGSGLDAGMAITVDSQGRAYVAGTTQSPDFPLKNALQTNFGDPYDAFVLRLNASGTTLDFSTLLGGQGTDEVFAIALDTNGDVYVAGLTSSPDFPVKNAFQPQFGGSAGNGFVTKLRGDGSAIVYSTFLGGADGQSQLNAIVVDASGSAYVAGQGGSDFPIVNSLQAYGGASDIVVAKLTPDGSGLLYSTFLGGSGADLASAIALDPTGKIVITGQTSSPNFPVSANALQPASTGLPDAFITRLVVSPSTTAVFSSPKLIPFGQVYVGQPSASQSITISNQGSAALTVTGLSGSSNLHATSNCGTVAPGARCSISANLLTATAGAQSGNITVFDNAPDSPQTIFVTATGVYGGDLQLSSLVIGSSFSYYGKTAVPLTATIVNHGPNDSSNAVVNVTSNAGSANCSPCYVGTIKAGSSAVARFNFLPSTYGAIPMTTEVEADPSTPDLNLANNALTVNIVNPRYNVSPSQLTFNNQIVNLPSSEQTITFSSADQNPLQLSFSVTGDFQVASACDPGALRCYAYITFLPTAGGTRNGTLSVTEAVAGTVQPIALSGVGILAPHIELSDTDLVFVDGVTGGLGMPHTIGVTNDGSAPLFLVSITITGSFVQANQCPPSLMPNTSCTITIQFRAATAGVFTGSLMLANNASEMFDMISLTATGIPLMNLVRPDRPTAASTTSIAPAPLPNPISIATPSRPSRPLLGQQIRRKLPGL